MAKNTNTNRMDFYVPDWAREEVVRFMDAQSNKGQALAIVVLDAIQKYGYEDCVAAKILSQKEEVVR